MMPSWPPERIDALKQLWAEGLSASQVAQRLGVTRGSVTGKVARLGLQGRADTSRAQSIRSRRRPQSAAPIPPPAGPSRDREERNHRVPLPLPSAQPEDIATISLLDAGDAHCRWPCAELDAVMFVYDCFRHGFRLADRLVQ